MDLPDIPEAGTERALLETFLDYQRIVIARKAEGLDPGQLVTRLEPSTLTVGGIIRHLTEVERWWFRDVFRAEKDLTYSWTDDDRDGDFRVPEGTTAESLVESYLAEIDICRESVAGAGLDELSANEPRGKRFSLRWILLHMIEETARHAGHADLIRESLDGSIGD